MIGLMQIMIYLLCVYLVFKGVEIFQIAFVTSAHSSSRAAGIVIGSLMTAVAVFVAVATVVVTEGMVAQVGKNMPKFP